MVNGWVVWSGVEWRWSLTLQRVGWGGVRWWDVGVGCSPLVQYTSLLQATTITAAVTKREPLTRRMVLILPVSGINRTAVRFSSQEKTRTFDFSPESNDPRKLFISLPVSNTSHFLHSCRQHKQFLSLLQKTLDNKSFKRDWTHHLGRSLPWRWNLLLLQEVSALWPAKKPYRNVLNKGFS